jgi:N-methylhydantoinase B
MDGGEEGSSNYVEVIKQDGESKGPFGVSARYPVNKGDIVKLVTATGGGYGNPLKRPAEQVVSDVKNGYISVVQAKEKFGVVIDSNTCTIQKFTLDRLNANSNECSDQE